jgi:dipeptidyl aminopeptidase/acylaminoacyl peptidase
MPVTTTTVAPVTTTTGRVVAPTQPSAPVVTIPGRVGLECSTSDPVAEVVGGGVTVIGQEGDVRRVIATQGYESIMSAVWAPDGRRVAVTRLRQEGGSVAVVDLDGRVVSVSGSDWADRPVAWTPDGRVLYVAVESRSDGPHYGVRMVDPSVGDATTVWEGRATTFGVTGVAGLADGRIIFLSDEGLMVVQRDGSDLHPLGTVGLNAGDPDAPQLPRVAVRNFGLSPDGRRIATIAGGEAAMIDIVTGAKLASTPTSGPSVLEWSADSRRVAFFDGTVLTDDGTVRHTGAADVAFPVGADLALRTAWQANGSADDGKVEVVGVDGSRQVVAHRASEIAGRLALAAIIDPAGDMQHGPRPGATICVVGRGRALASFPDADPHTLTWSPDGSRLLVIHDFIDWIRP